MTREELTEEDVKIIDAFIMKQPEPYRAMYQAERENILKAALEGKKLGNLLFGIDTMGRVKKGR